MWWWMPKKKPSETDRKLDRILGQLTALTRHGERIMSKLDDITAQLDAIDAQTNEIAADIDKLLATPLAGLTDAEAQAVVDRLAAHSETLKGIAAKS
jgi:ABC-type transporter Mla subunit MlaD